MTDLFDNPMGLMGFEFVEFAAPVPDTLEPVFERLGFSLVAVFISLKTVSKSALSTTTVTEPWFFAAARNIVGPPISMFSIASSSVQPALATVCSNG